MIEPGGGHRADAQPQAGLNHDAETPQDLETAREQVEQTREELGQTVAALAEKVDVKARTREKVTVVKERATQAAGHAGHTAQAKAAALKDRTAVTTSRVAVRAHRFRPADVRAAGSRAASSVQRHPAVLAALAGVALVGLAVWWRQR